MNEIIRVTDLKKHFEISKGLFRKTKNLLKAVDGVSFYINEGETLGLVGESGCGKTTTGRLVLRLLEPTSGEVLYRGLNIYNLKGEKMRKLRRDMQIIFQDPYASLNPRETVLQALVYPFKLHGDGSGDEIKDRARKLLVDVGLTPPEQFMERYPHQLSGGQRQRVVIARAIALNPSFIVADEPVSSLDLSIQAQILKLMREIRQRMKMSLLFISHDLSVVRYMSNRVAVMYLGRIVELASVSELFSRPAHPYTQALLSATPVPDPVVAKGRKRILLQGDPPSPVNLPKGCRFFSRCPRRMEICRKVDPALLDIDKNHLVACHLYG